MQLFRLARRPTHAIRAVLVALLLSLGCNAVAHAAHSHTDSIGTNVHAACGYCAAFDAFAAAPDSTNFRTGSPIAVFVVVAFLSAALVFRTPTAALPRAPPRS